MRGRREEINHEIYEIYEKGMREIKASGDKIMPIYEYKCEKCGKTYELLRSISAEDKDIICPKCSAKKKAKKLISSLGSIAGSCGASSSGFT